MASLCRVFPATGSRLADGLCKSFEAGLRHLVDLQNKKILKNKLDMAHLTHPNIQICFWKPITDIRPGAQDGYSCEEGQNV